jgi:predicted nucleotide-binding protein
MIERFIGEANKKNLLDVLKRQFIIGDDEKLASEILSKIELIEFKENDEIIVEDGTDTDLYLIFTGRVSIQINNREIAIRSIGEHVGEMALIDITTVRSASVVALESTVTGKISEIEFSKIAEENPKLWRLIALKLGNRLRQRNILIPERNPRPVVFIGSSSESLEIAQKIQSAFSEDDFIVNVWNKNVFQPSDFPIENLMSQAHHSDFAVLVLGPDDITFSRDNVYDSPRDNVIFELGLFTGSLTRHRTFIIIPKKLDIKIPSDLFGINVLKYTDDTTLLSVCDDLRKIVLSKGTK